MPNVAAATQDLSRALRDLHHVESQYGVVPEAEAQADADRGVKVKILTDPVIRRSVMPPVASFGEIAPVVAPTAAVHAIWPGDPAEPTFFDTSVRQ